MLQPRPFLILNLHRGKSNRRSKKTCELAASSTESNRWCWLLLILVQLPNNVKFHSNHGKLQQTISWIWSLRTFWILHMHIQAHEDFTRISSLIFFVFQLASLNFKYIQKCRITPTFFKIKCPFSRCSFLSIFWIYQLLNVIIYLLKEKSEEILK